MPYLLVPTQPQDNSSGTDRLALFKHTHTETKNLNGGKKEREREKEGGKSLTMSEEIRATDTSTAAFNATSGTTNPTESVQSPPPVLGYGFPKPQGKIDVEEALNRKPLRWTFRGQVEANRARPAPEVLDHRREKDLEQAKQDMLEMQGALSQSNNFNSKSG